MSESAGVDRRTFLRASLAAAALPPLLDRQSQGRVVALVADPADEVVAATPVVWALGELERALTTAGVHVSRVERLDRVPTHSTCVLATSEAARASTGVVATTQFRLGPGPERLALVPGRFAGGDVLLAVGSDARGLTYALLELADRVRSGATPLAALTQDTPIIEAPTNPVRSVMRQFTSQTLDTPWLHDRDMWPAYLTMLASHRFNRLHLAFGLGYDTLQQVTDSYALFLYPFVVRVPGYDVRVTNLTDAERDANLETLRFISAETAARGLTFQLGLWMHGYALLNSPRARYVVEGLTADTHAAYCRDALTAVLEACPAISAVALRIHGESGVAEGSYDFWQTVFDGVRRSGRTVEIDLHAKGIDATMIDRALATGMPVNLSPKYWAEHLGMPYHQTAIRELEMPVAGRTGRGLMTLSEGSRSFTRYGYADLLRDDRRYTVRHRVFAGTQRLLLAADPEATAAYSRMFQFCGSAGVDLMEPLTCIGRRGTGAEGVRRSGYVDTTYETRWDWQKYAYWYRVWGRCTYNAETDIGSTRRGLPAGPGGDALAAALASASRILPIVTTAHLPSAACDAFWPEIYWNQPMAAEPRPNPYGDTPAPRTFTHVSPLDPQIFSRIDEFAAELATGRPTGKYSPFEVAGWLDGLADDVERQMGIAGDTRRAAALDARLQADLGRFFAEKLRAGVLYALHERSGDAAALDAALGHYRRARGAWAALAGRARGVYEADIPASDRISERGQWADRLEAIDRDIAQLAERVPAAAPSTDPHVAAAVKAATARTPRPPAPCTHTPPAAFQPGTPLRLELSAVRGRDIASATCYYRHVNQAERFESMTLAPAGARWQATIPAAYSNAPFPLQYYFLVTDGSGTVNLYPGLGPDHLQQPYIVVRRSS
jgi:hypothetical protein